MADVTLTGFPELDRYFDGLTLKVQKKALRDALKVAAIRVAQEAKHNTADPLIAGSVEVKAMKRSRVRVGRSVLAGAEYTDGRDDGRPWYATFVELGTRARYHKSGHYVGAIQPPRPFLRPALLNNERRIISVFRDKMATWVREQRAAAHMPR